MARSSTVGAGLPTDRRVVGGGRPGRIRLRLQGATVAGDRGGHLVVVAEGRSRLGTHRSGGSTRHRSGGGGGSAAGGSGALIDHGSKVGRELATVDQVPPTKF